MAKVWLIVAITLAVAHSQQSERSRYMQVINDLSRQLLQQQLYAEERVRSDGSSGVKQIRYGQAGSKTYYSNTHTGPRVGSIHNHANHVRTVGMGELIAVLNGVEFRTRHNDYKLVMSAPSDNNTMDYNKVVDIPFPSVPPQVRGTVEQQIVEMRKWFKAWADQDHSERDYRQYFKPVLCYLEGSWTSPDGEAIDEPFDSDRHHLDAKTWFELQNKLRFTSYAGSKSTDENFAYLPTTIMGVRNGFPVFAQWNYRILCHPLSKDLPLNRFGLVDELHSRMAYRKSRKQQEASRAARFKIAPEDKDNWRDRMMKYEFLDTLMEEIPGKNGYNARLEDALTGRPALHYKGGPLNSAYYHRWFRGTKDAMGTQVAVRGFSDGNIFMAMTTQPKVAGMEVEYCKRRRCNVYSQKWTYAIPLEIIYLTPLHSWNPYNIQYRGKISKAEIAATGGRNASTAHPGSAHTLFYHTPKEFFTTANSGRRDRADTSNGVQWIRDGDGTPREVLASGIRVQLPEIEGIEGNRRTRYPVMPLHTEGNVVWKELEALKDFVLEPEKYNFVKDGLQNSGSGPINPGVSQTLTLELATSENPVVEQHQHDIPIDLETLKSLYTNRGETVNITTSQEQGHTHNLQLKVGWFQQKQVLKFIRCDGKWQCWDTHPRVVSVDPVIIHALRAGRK